MSAKELRVTLNELTVVIGRACNDERVKDITALTTIWSNLEQHRLEMEEAETARKCVICRHRECVENSSLCAGCYKTVARSNAATKDAERPAERPAESPDRTENANVSLELVDRGRLDASLKSIEERINAIEQRLDEIVARAKSADLFIAQQVEELEERLASSARRSRSKCDSIPTI